MSEERKMIPLFWPPRQNVDRMLAELRDTLSGRWWGQGPKVDEFERRFGEKFGFRHCVMVNSGTAALWLAYELSGVDHESAVIVPVLTCTATCHPLKHLDADIEFADIYPDTLTQNPLDVIKRITRRTKVIVLVHLGGAVDMEARRVILEVARPRGIRVVEDACQALGVQGVGMDSDFACFSFQAIKGLSTGDGGMLVCRDEDDYRRAKRLRWFDIDREQKADRGWQAWDRRGITFDQVYPGFKFQATDIDASIGLAALDDFDDNQAHRARLVEEYERLLEGSSIVDLVYPVGGGSNWLFMVRVVGDRDAFAERLLEAGVETNVAHIRNDVFTLFGPRREDLPGMDAAERRYLCLPLNGQVTLDDVRYICGVIRGME